MKYVNDPTTKADEIGFVLDKLYPHLCLIGALILGGSAFILNLPSDARLGLSGLASTAIASGATAFRSQNNSSVKTEEQVDDLP